MLTETATAAGGRLAGPHAVFDRIRDNLTANRRDGGSALPPDAGATLATPEQSEAAVRAFIAGISALDPAVRRRYAVKRTVSCLLTDHDSGFSARMDAKGDVLVVPGIDPHADVRLRCSSDDFVELLHRRLDPRAAWSAGRLTVDASTLDLLRLRALL